jgi:hypothetical protein
MLYQLGPHLIRAERLNSVDNPVHEESTSHFIAYVAGRKLKFEEVDDLEDYALRRRTHPNEEASEAYTVMKKERQERIIALHAETVALFRRMHGGTQ